LLGRSRGEDGNDRTPEPLTPGLFSNTDRKDRELDEL
jgi:hypothetical protein